MGGGKKRSITHLLFKFLGGETETSPLISLVLTCWFHINSWRDILLDFVSR